MLDNESNIKNKKEKKEYNHDILTRLYGAPKWKKFATIDIETDGWEKPYAVGFHDGIDYFDFIGPNCIEESLLFVLQEKYIGYRIYAHNGGRFDYLFFVMKLLTSKKLNKSYNIEIVPSGSSVLRLDVFALDRTIGLSEDRKPVEKIITKLKTNYVKYKWTFLDSFRLFPMRLDEVGESFGIGKKVTLNMSYTDLAKEENRYIMKQYLEQDCKLLYKCIDRFQYIINKMGGEVGITLPSTALNLYRRAYQTDYLYTNRHFITCEDYGRKTAESKCEGCGHELIRPATKGGRCEIFKMRFIPNKYAKEAKVYDFNSMYPSVMLHDMPVGQGILINNIKESDLYSNAEKKIGIVECEVFIPEKVYLPPLPWKETNTSKLLFPTGHFSGTWDTSELLLLKDIPGAKINKIRRSIWFDKSPIFKNFVTDIYKFRVKDKNWNKGMDDIAKLLLNSLYGIFGMKEWRERYITNPPKEILTELTSISMENNIWSQDVRVTPKYIIPQLAIHITSLARIKLWITLRDVLRQGGILYYCDTDSIVCSNAELKTGTKLGELKLEDIIYEGSEWILPKLYKLFTEKLNTKKRLEQNIKIKAKGLGPGLPMPGDPDREYGKELSEEEFDSLTKFGAPVERHRLTMLKEGMRDLFKKGLHFPRAIQTAKELRTKYDKRIVLDNFDTKPIFMKKLNEIKSTY